MYTCPFENLVKVQIGTRGSSKCHRSVFYSTPCLSRTSFLFIKFRFCTWITWKSNSILFPIRFALLVYADKAECATNLFANDNGDKRNVAFIEVR